MTYEEAIIKFLPITDNMAYTDVFQDACKVAIEALEKQIPKKPIIKVYDDEDEETHKNYKWKFYLCSECGENIALKSYTHCHCGQAIDWSDEK